MSQTPTPEGRDGMSRRDFVQGRFWRAIGRKSASDADEKAIKNRRLSRLVMRYPKTIGEVAAGDSSSTVETATDAVPATSARRRTIPIMRPPGAIDEVSFLDGCTRCDQCVKACPHDAIVHAPLQYRQAAGTPMVNADQQACMMCEDFPCIAACEPNVLTSLVPPMMGIAMVTEHLCLAHHGTTCTVCSERCPVEDAMDVTDGKPTVNENICTGCGVCRYVCVAPENAVLLMPTFIRPSPTGTESHE